MQNIKKINVSFFQSSSGKEPVKQWLKELDKDDRKKVGVDIKTVELGWPIGMPVCRNIGGGIYEVRTELKNTIARVLFCIEGNQMVLLHGFIKKSQKTPKDELELARKRYREVK